MLFTGLVVVARFHNFHASETGRWRFGRCWLLYPGLLRDCSLVRFIAGLRDLHPPPTICCCLVLAWRLGVRSSCMLCVLKRLDDLAFELCCLLVASCRQLLKHLFNILTGCF